MNNILKINTFFTTSHPDFICKIIVFYDNSTDRSLSILNSYVETYGNMEIIINDKERTNLRTKNIAYARNKCLEKIKEKYSHFPYFIMMDSNEYSCIGNINVLVLEKVLQKTNDWDAISFDREAGYYDTWALSFDPYIYSFFHFQNWNKVVDAMRSSFNDLLNEYKLSKPEELIPVYSAFNGFSLYKTEKFLNCSYSSDINLSLFPLDIVRKQIHITKCNILSPLYNDCEHRHFHLEAIQKNSAKIRICRDYLFAKFENPPKGLRGPA